MQNDYIIKLVFVLISTFITVQAIAQTNTLPTGWSMVGNDTGASIDAVSIFGNKTTPTAISARVTTVWSWNNSQSRWNFFSPGMTAQELSDYAASHQYGVLSSIAKAEGFWVNAKSAFVYSPTVSTIPVDSTPPSVSSVSPVHYDTGVLLRSTISVIFSEVMDASTITSANFTIGGVTGTVMYSGNKAIFTPSTVLAVSTKYAATITTGAKDAAGNRLANDYSWTFTTCTPKYVDMNLFVSRVDYNLALSKAYQACM